MQSANLPKICLGTMTWGEQNSREEAFAQMDYALERGVTFWDTAEMYAVPPRAETYASTERIIGSWFSARGLRHRVFLATKVIGRNPGMYWIRDGGKRDNGYGNEDSLIQACEDSLRRLNTEYIDLYQLHWPERTVNNFGRLGFTPDLQEQWSLERMISTLRGLEKLLRDGKIRSWGVSNESAWGLMKYLRLADELGIARPVNIQNPYSLLNRSAEVALAEICYREGVHFMAYSVLGMGMLTGKYDRGTRPPGARLTLFGGHFKRYSGERAVLAAERYNDLARRFGLTPAQLAIAWVNSRLWMGSVILGGTNIEQLRENFDAMDRVLSPEILDAVEKIHQEFVFPAP